MIALIASLFLTPSCTKEEEDIFSGTVWQGKYNTTNVPQPRTFGYRITFTNNGRYRVTELDKDGYAYKEESQGTYSYKEPNLVLRESNGRERVYTYHRNQQSFWGYNYLVDFFKQ